MRNAFYALNKKNEIVAISLNKDSVTNAVKQYKDDVSINTGVIVECERHYNDRLVRWFLIDDLGRIKDKSVAPIELILLSGISDIEIKEHFTVTKEALNTAKILSKLTNDEFDLVFKNITSYDN